MIFKTQDELVSFLKTVPKPSGLARVGGAQVDAATIINRCVALAPSIFEYKAMLAKGAGGLGSSKAVLRYVEAASDNVSNEAIKRYDAAVIEIENAVSLLIEMGGGDDLANQLHSARTAVERFKMVRDSILGFKAKLHKYMSKVEERYAEINANLSAKKKILRNTLGEEDLASVLQELNGRHKKVTELIEAMDEYCDLQVAYNGILIGALGA